jgi:hypothetical protein
MNQLGNMNYARAATATLSLAPYYASRGLWGEGERTRPNFNMTYHPMLHISKLFVLMPYPVLFFALPQYYILHRYILLHETLTYVKFS